MVDSSQSGSVQVGGSQNGSGPIVTLNPPFDPRMRQIGSPNWNKGKLERGWMYTTNGPNGNGRYRINFEYNPSSISVSHVANINMPRPTQVKANANSIPGATAYYVAPNGSSLAFSLLFDRTYDLYNYHSPDQRTLSTTFGCYADVAAFYYYLGIINTLPSTVMQSPPHIHVPGMPDPPVIERGWATMSPYLPPYYFASYVYIGDKMFYYGSCNSITITYTHWNYAMVPMRCEIDLSFTLFQTPGATKTLVNTYHPNAGGSTGNTKATGTGNTSQFGSGGQGQ